jgi:hypothetical protein
MHRLCAGEPILIIEDAWALCSLIEDTFVGPIWYPRKTELEISINKDLLQLLPLHVLSLHAGAHKLYVECKGRTLFLHAIYGVLARYMFFENWRGQRFYIVGDLKPFFILEEGKCLSYYAGSALGWVVYKM